MSFAFFGDEETIAIGNTDYNDFLQRSTIYNGTHVSGIGHADSAGEQFFFEAGMLLEEIKIENEYIKLPDLHFFAGNKDSINVKRESKGKTGVQVFREMCAIIHEEIGPTPAK